MISFHRPPGSVVFFEDVSGKGHKSVAVDGSKKRRSLFVPVDDWVGAHHAKLGSAATAAKPTRASEEDAVVALATELQRLRSENERLAKEVTRLGGSPASSKGGLAWLRDPLRDVLGIGGGASASAVAAGAEPSPPPLSFREAMKDAFGLQAMKETFAPAASGGEKPASEGLAMDSAIRDAIGLKKKAPVPPPQGQGAAGAPVADPGPEAEPDLGLNFVKDLRDAFSFGFGGAKKKGGTTAGPSSGSTPSGKTAAEAASTPSKGPGALPAAASGEVAAVTSAAAAAGSSSPTELRATPPADSVPAPTAAAGPA